MMTMRDSIHSSELNQMIQDAEARYQLAVKEADIARRDADLAQELIIRRQLYWIVAGIGAVALFLMVMAWFIRRARMRLAEKNKQIALALEEREMLMREIHHRVKNNIQSVRSMLQIEKRRSPQETQQTIERILMRLNAMTFVHDHLYQQNVLTKLNLSEYLPPLCQSIIASMGFQHAPHQVEVRFEDAEVNVEQLISLGTILNELITNSCKYGAKDGVLNLQIKGMLQLDSKMYLISLSDQGNGISETAPKGFGTDLIQAMSAKLQGKLEWGKSEHGGLLVSLTFPL